MTSIHGYPYESARIKADIFADIFCISGLPTGVLAWATGCSPAPKTTRATTPVVGDNNIGWVSSKRLLVAFTVFGER